MSKKEYTPLSEDFLSAFNSRLKVNFGRQNVVEEAKEQATIEEASCGSKKMTEAELDPVNKKAVKKDFEDRADKDIDNDGDEDSSDKYLHKRRKAISKALAKEEVEDKDDDDDEDEDEDEDDEEDDDEDELDEAIDFFATSKALLDAAKKEDKVDRVDFEKAAAYVREIGKNSSTMVQNKAFTGLKKHLDGMDSQPRDGVLNVLQKHGMIKNNRLVQEALEIQTAKHIDDAGEDKALSYGRKKGYKEAGVIGQSPIKAMVLFKLRPEDKGDLKGANIQSGEQVFRYATRQTVAGDIFPLIKVNFNKGMVYFLTQESSSGEIDQVKFENRGMKLKFARMLSGMVEQVDLDEEMAGWIAIYKGKKVEIKKDEAKDLYSAKMKAAKDLKVPKSKMGLLAIQPAYNEEVELDEAEKMKGEDPCWKGYEMIGKKKKNGKEVPNCVPKEEVKEYYDTGAGEEVTMGIRQLHFIMYAAEEIIEYLEMRGDMDEWYQNKLANVHSMMQSLHSYAEGDKHMQGMDESVELDEGIMDKVKAGIKKVLGKYRLDKAQRKASSELRSYYDDWIASGGSEERFMELVHGTGKQLSLDIEPEEMLKDWLPKVRRANRRDDRLIKLRMKKESVEVDEGAFKGVGKFLAKRKFAKNSKQAVKDAEKSLSKLNKYPFYDVKNREPHEKDFIDKMKKSDRYDRAAKRLNREEVELDEASYPLASKWQSGAKVVKKGKVELTRGSGGVHSIKVNGKSVGDFSLDDDSGMWVTNVKGKKGQGTYDEIDDIVNAVMKESVELDEATDFRAGDKVKRVGSNQTGEVLHKGNRDQIIVKFGSISKTIPSSELRLVESVDKEKIQKQIDQAEKQLKSFGGNTSSVKMKKYAIQKKIDKLKAMLGEEVEQIDEKAVSQAQQKMMGMALAYKRGEMDDASPEVKKMADSMSEKDLEDFAKTKHKGLPVKKESYLTAALKRAKSNYK